MSDNEHKNYQLIPPEHADVKWFRGFTKRRWPLYSFIFLYFLLGFLWVIAWNQAFDSLFEDDPRFEAIWDLAAEWGFVIISGTLLFTFLYKSITAYAHSQAFAKTSQNEYRALIEEVLDHSEVAVLILDAESKVVWANDTVYNFFTITPAELIGHDKRSVIDHHFKTQVENPERFATKLKQSITENKRVEKLECHVLPAGEREERWLKHWSRPIAHGMYSGGRIEHYYDITSMKRAEQNMITTSSAIEGLFRASPVPMMLLDTEGRVEMWNKAAEDTFGWNRIEIIGDPYPLAPPEKQLEFQKNLQLILEGNTIKSQLVQRKKKDGTPVTASLSAAPIALYGEPTGIMAVMEDVTEKEMLISQLKEGEQRFKGLYNHIADPIFLIDKDGKIWDVNKSACTLLKYSYDSLVGKILMDIAPGIKDISEIEKVLGVDDTSSKLFRTKLQKNSIALDTLPVELQVRRFDWQEKRGYIAVARDISERLRAEKEIAENERKFRALIERSSEIIVMLSSTGAIEYASPSLERLLGTNAATLLGQKFQDVLPDSERPPIMEALNTSFATPGVPHKFELRVFSAKVKEMRIFDSTAVVFVEERGQSLILNMHDITERHLAEEALLESEEEYRELFEDNLAGHYISTPEGKLLKCNTAFAQILGYEDRAQLQQVPVPNLYRDTSERKKVVSLLYEKNAIEGHEMELVKKDGTSVHVKLTASAVTDENGDIKEIRGQVTDFTQQKLLERQLLQSQKMEAVGRLAGGIAHDFNNQLTAIKGLADLLLKELPPENEIRSDIEEIRKAGLHAAQLTNQLLAFSRQQVLHREIFNVNEEIEDLESLLRRLLKDDIKLELDLSKDLLPVEADRTQIRQVLMNLAINAQDAMPHGGVLAIMTFMKDKATPSSPAVHIEVSDTGHGIAPEDLGKVFDPFFSKKPSGSGTGLGLATAYGIIEQSGGSISVESSPGQGSTFHIQLPPTEASPSSPLPTTTKEESKRNLETTTPLSPSEHTILLAEDEEVVRTFVTRSLRKEGFNVLPAADGQEALEILASAENSISLLLTDIVMPGMSGLELAKRVKKESLGTPIILTSGYAPEDLANREELKALGTFVKKPFDMDNLIKFLASTLRDSLTDQKKQASERKTS